MDRWVDGWVSGLMGDGWVSAQVDMGLLMLGRFNPSWDVFLGKHYPLSVSW